MALTRQYVAAIRVGSSALAWEDYRDVASGGRG
jgi:hypothetical protein